MNIFFISDTHFGHEAILKFENYYRPFRTIEEHDEKLIENWNQVVKKGDRVYHLGDFVFKKDLIWKLRCLNGSKYLIMGNHDHYETKSYLKVFDKCLGSMQFQNSILTHIPINSEQFGRFDYNIHGHLHSKVLDDKRYINVSCEQINLAPIALEDLQKRMTYEK